MEGKILRSGNGWVLRYTSEDLQELRRIATMVSAITKQEFMDYGVHY